jgi:hypothetical protein
VHKRTESVRDNIKIDLGEIGWGGVVWIGLAQDMDKWRVSYSQYHVCYFFLYATFLFRFEREGG